MEKKRLRLIISYTLEMTSVQRIYYIFVCETRTPVPPKQTHKTSGRTVITFKYINAERAYNTLPYITMYIYLYIHNIYIYFSMHHTNAI